jgi:hypothetical protein
MNHDDESLFEADIREGGDRGRVTIESDSTAVTLGSRRFVGDAAGERRHTLL